MWTRCCPERLVGFALCAAIGACRAASDEGTVALDAGPPDDDRCVDGDNRECYSGPPGTEGVGACVAGVSRCKDGSWSSCIAEVGPLPESCDRTDEDCDGEADEGFATLECGPCREEDECLYVGAGGEPFGLEGSEGVSVELGVLRISGPRGTWSHTFEGQCESAWNSLRFEAETPGESDVEVFGRRASLRPDGLDSIGWQRLGSLREDGSVLPTPLSTDNLEVLLLMRGDRVDPSESPVVRSLSACWCWRSCTI